jgi:hypothetical protein
MRTVLMLLAICLTTWPLAAAQSLHSPYAGQAPSDIRALSLEDIHGYLTGAGMGLAKAAELHQYPGPKHVLEAAHALGISAAQMEQTQAVYQKMHTEAVRLGHLIVAQEQHLDRLFRDHSIDEAQLRTVVSNISRLQGELRVVHLHAHLEMRRLLSPAQIDQYDTLRGYKTRQTTGAPQHQHRGH